MICASPDNPLDTHNYPISCTRVESGTTLKSNLVQKNRNLLRFIKEKIILAALQCSDSEFTCNDGSCISLAHRCNILRDCKDNSDELRCDLVRIDDDQVPVLKLVNAG